MKALALVTADSTDPQTLGEMTRRCRVVVSSAGPFRLYGSNLVRACVENGTDYCDITGEIDWVREMIDHYGGLARASGSRVVFCCGADSVPWDLATFLLQEQLAQNSEALVRVDHFNDGKGSFSGGTLKSLLLKLDGQVPKEKQKMRFDPLMAEFDDSDMLVKSNAKTKIVSDKCLGKDPTGRGWTMLSLLGFGNSRVVSRSNAVLHYHNRFVYREVTVSQSFVNSFNFYVGLTLLVTVLLVKPLRRLVLALGLLPSPGQGPTEALLRMGYWIVDSVGTGSDGSKVRLRTTFKKEIGYVDTARIMVESGLCLVFGKGKCEAKGGMYTPAICFGTELKDRLEQSGTEFDFY